MSALRDAALAFVASHETMDAAVWHDDFPDRFPELSARLRAVAEVLRAAADADPSNSLAAPARDAADARLAMPTEEYVSAEVFHRGVELTADEAAAVRAIRSVLRGPVVLEMIDGGRTS